MRDIRSPTLMGIKAALFVTAGFMAAGGILLEQPELRTAVLLVVMAWCFARAYYFAFYVIGHYIDREYQFAGLWSLMCHVMRQRRRIERSSQFAGLCTQVFIPAASVR